MRIISGRCGGISITVPKTVLRPTADRVREAVFSILGERVAGAAALDLFAGSGAYGLEALSRGARAVTFVESERGACDVIKQNLARTRITGGHVICTRVESFLRQQPASMCELILADPPYQKAKTDHNWDAELLSHEGLPKHLAPQGLFVLESFARSAKPPEDDSPWRITDERRYGDSLLRFFSLKTDARPTEMETPPGAAAV